MKHLIGVLVLVGVVGCGSSTPTAPSTVQVAGVWLGTTQITSASGGECVGPSLGIGSATTVSLQVSQSGSALTAVATSTTNGNSTNYTGTAGANSIALNATFSTAAFTFGFRCSNGAIRDLQQTAGTVTATITGNTGSGTQAQSYNVFVAGTSTSVGVLTLTGSFTMTRQ